MGKRRTFLPLALLAVAGSTVMTACDSATSSTTDGPVVVVTNSILSSVVEQLVGDQARVHTLIADGTDPHEYAPSPRDIESLSNADLIVRNGGGFDRSLDRVISDARSGGVPVFVALDHVTSPPPGVAGDPHFFTDPESMSQVVAALADEIDSKVGITVDAAARALESELANVSQEMFQDRVRLNDRSGTGEACLLVTGHESLAYLAGRYDCVVLGTVIPGLSSSADATAADLADIRKAATAHDVGAIFVESTLSSRVASQLADDLGLRVVQLDVERLGPSRTYQEYVRALMHTIVEGLLTT